MNSLGKNIEELEEKVFNADKKEIKILSDDILRINAEENINRQVYTQHLLIDPKWHTGVDVRIREEIHNSGEFEFYFGVKETPERLSEISINRELFYSIYEEKSSNLLGYLGFTPIENDSLEVEIYIFKGYRKKGYATEALSCILQKIFGSELFVERESIREGIITERIVSTVRRENVASQKMMEKLGFKRNENMAIGFSMMVNPEDENEMSFFEIVEYVLEKEDMMRSTRYCRSGSDSL